MARKSIGSMHPRMSTGDVIPIVIGTSIFFTSRVADRYDFIFLSSHLTPEGVEYREDILDKGRSDHAPLVARLALRLPTEEF